MWLGSPHHAADAEVVTVQDAPAIITGLTRLARGAWSEVWLSWRFLRSNFPPSVIATAVFAVSGWHVAHAPLWRLPSALAAAVGLSWLFLYAHELPNQALGADEDAVDKPHRPIPSGFCTVTGARLRWLVVAPAYLLCAWALGVAWWAVAWIASIAVYHYGGGHRWWPYKTFHAALGAPVILASGWAASDGPASPLVWSWLAAAFGYWAGVGLLQDLRDTAGDALVNRRTLPMVIGDRACRWSAAAFLALLPLTGLLPLLAWAGPTPAVVAYTAAYTLTSWCLASRVLRQRTRHDDDLTYKAYAALFCALAAGPLLT